MMPAITAVIPGHREAMSPESISPRSAGGAMDSGLALRAPLNDGGSDG